MCFLCIPGIFAERAFLRTWYPRQKHEPTRHHRRRNAATVAMAIVVGACMLCVQAFAQGGDGSGRRVSPATPKKLAIQEIVRDREGVIREVLRRRFLPRTGSLSDPAELEIALRKLSDGRLADALLATKLPELKDAVLGEPAVLGGVVGPQFLGNATADLVFTPLSQPCRLFNTRKDNRGPMSKNETRAFAVQGAFISNQGGDNADCPEVPFDPPAVVVTITAVRTQGTGIMKVWPFGNPRPQAISLSFRRNVDVSNTTLTGVCQNCGSQNDINVRVQSSRSQVIGEIIGYFERPEGCAPDRTEIAGHCFETTLRNPNPADDLFDATNVCEDEGGRLPTAAETFLVVNTLAGSAGGEHTGTVYNADENNSASGFRNLRITSSGTLISQFTLDTDPYRCVFDLFAFN